MPFDTRYITGIMLYSIRNCSIGVGGTTYTYAHRQTDRHIHTHTHTEHEENTKVNINFALRILEIIHTFCSQNSANYI